MKPKLLISRCFLGVECAYDGTSKLIPEIDAISEVFDLVDVCPEVDGGLMTPRTPSEISGGDGIDVLEQRARVLSSSGEDRTKIFTKGANIALKLAKKNSVKSALMKAKSPSCSNCGVYDGTFCGKLVSGSGVAAAILKKNGIIVYNEFQVDKLLQATR